MNEENSAPLSERLNAAQHAYADQLDGQVLSLLQEAEDLAAQQEHPLTDSEIGAVIWHTIRTSGHVGWGTFARELLAVDRDRALLAEMQRKMKIAYGGNVPATFPSSNVQVKRQGE